MMKRSPTTVTLPPKSDSKTPVGGSRLDHAEDVARVDVVTDLCPRVGHGPLRQIERREALDGELPGRDGRVRERDTEASFRKAAHAVFGVRNAHAEHYDTECDD